MMRPLMYRGKNLLLYADDAIVVVYKPAGLAVQTKKMGRKKIWKACCVPGRQDRAQARTSVWCIDWISRWRASWCWPGQKRLRQL